MALSACPGCGAITEHGEDASVFYNHVAECPKAQALAGIGGKFPAQYAQGAAVSPELDKLWDELREAAATPGGTMLKEAIEKVMHPLLSFDGAVTDYLNLAEDVPMQTFLKILAMVPSIIGIVKQTEDTITGPGKGPEKLNLVLNTVNAAASSVPEVAASLAGHDLNATVTAIVNGAVSAMNAAKGGPQQ